MTLDRLGKVNISKCWIAGRPSEGTTFIDLDQSDVRERDRVGKADSGRRAQGRPLPRGNRIESKERLLEKRIHRESFLLEDVAEAS